MKTFNNFGGATGLQLEIHKDRTTVRLAIIARNTCDAIERASAMTVCPADRVPIAELLAPDGFEVVKKGTRERLQRTISAGCKHINAANSDITDLKMALAHERGCAYEDLDGTLRSDNPEPEPEEMPANDEFAAMTMRERAIWAIGHISDDHKLSGRSFFYTKHDDGTWGPSGLGIRAACRLFRDIILAERQAEAEAAREAEEEADRKEEEAKNWSEPIGEMDACRVSQVANMLGYTIHVRLPDIAAFHGEEWLTMTRDAGQDHNVVSHDDPVRAARATLGLLAQGEHKRRATSDGYVNGRIWLGEGPMPKESPECTT